MKVVQINSVCGLGSTGKIVCGIYEVSRKMGIDSYILYGVGNSDFENSQTIEGPRYLKMNVLFTRIFGKHGFYSFSATRRLIKILNEIAPDIIHLHNIHGHYLNVKMLFNYIKKSKIKVVWTLHDCWAITGHCSHFDYIGCEKWKSGCYGCSQLKEYPKSLIFDRSKEAYKDKKTLFSGVKDLIIVTPSEWLAGKVRESFLKEYPITVIKNGVSVLKIQRVESDLRHRLGLMNKKVILGICMKLHTRKGGDYLIELAGMLNDEQVLVILGLETKEKLPDNVIVLPRTNSVEELSKVYSMADVFVNTSLEETLSTVNIEAQVCGTPVVTFDSGGCPETVCDECGIVVRRGDMKALYNGVCKILEKQDFYSDECIKRASSEFDEREKFMEYVKLYNSFWRDNNES